MNIDELALKVRNKTGFPIFEEDIPKFSRALIAEYEKAAGGEPVAYLYKYLNCFGDEVWTPEHNWGNRTPIESKSLYTRPDPRVAELEAEVAELKREKEYRYVEQVLRPIKILIALAQSAETLASNSEESVGAGDIVIMGMASDFETLSENLDLLDELPDDKPGYTLSAAAKAAWALRDILGENYD